MGAILRWLAVLPVFLLLLSTNSNANAPAGVSAQTWVSKLTPVVGESVVVTVRLYSIGNLRHVELHRPELEQATLEELQGPMTGLRVVQGTPMITNDFQYLLVPEQPGNLQIKPFHLKVTASNEGLWRTAAMPSGLEVESDPINLTVQPMAADAMQDLPATSLKISARIVDPWLAEAAEAMVYRVTSVARGADGERIPEVVLPAQTSDFDISKTQSRTETHVLANGYGIEGTRIDSFRLAPRHKGDLTIPGVEMAWWNTALEEVETTVLPASKLMVGTAEELEAAAKNSSFSPLSDRIRSEHAFNHFLMPVSLGLIMAVMLGVWICGPGLHRSH